MTRLALAIFFPLLTAGCLVLPVGTSKPIADVAPHLPADLLASKDNVLVLAQSYVSRPRKFFTFEREKFQSWETKSVVSARILRGNELAALKDGLTQSSTSGLFLLFCGGYSCGSDTLQRERRDIVGLCVISADGTEITLRPFARAWSVNQPVAIHSARRDAIVAALRTDAARAFETLDGPCGIMGSIDWSPEARANAVTFLAAMPDRAPAPYESPFSTIASEARAGVAAEGGVMILAMARWRDHKMPLAPLFLGGDGFAKFEKITQGSRALDLAVFFPDHLAAHTAGTRALDSLKIDNLCAISSRGEVVYWSANAGAWQKLEQLPPYRDWQTLAIQNLTGAGALNTFRDSCAPIEPPGWSQAELAQAVAFLGALPTQPAPHGATNIFAMMLAEPAAANVAETPGLVLIATAGENGKGDVLPFFLLKGEERNQFIKVMASIAPDDLLSALPGTLALAASRHATRFCVVTPAGVATALPRQADKNEWGAARDTRVSIEFRESGDTPAAGGEAPDSLLRACALDRVGWPAEINEKLTEFVKRIALPARGATGQPAR